MSLMSFVMVGWGCLVGVDQDALPRSAPADLPRLREMLQDRQHPRQQSQAALLLIQHPSPDAAEIIRQGLLKREDQEVFLVLTDALAVVRDARFNKELLGALASDRPVARQAAAETLALLADDELIGRLHQQVENNKLDLALRQAALTTLGQSNRKAAAWALLQQLVSDQEAIRLAAAEALKNLTGLTFGTDIEKWRVWWKPRQDLSEDRWLEERLGYQASRARRLASDLERSRSQVVRLHQQLYDRMAGPDRLGQVQAVMDHEDAAVRSLAVAWSLELYQAAEAVGQRALADSLLKLSNDPVHEVQRAAVLGLGRVQKVRAFDRLHALVDHPNPSIRSAALRGLAQQATSTSPETAKYVAGLRSRVVPALQKALEDPALEVVIEAAEDLGGLGVPEAGPVLTALLRHSSEQVRKAAAQALERVASPAILDDLLKALADKEVTVRFSLVGATGRAAMDPRGLGEAQRTKLLVRLEELLARDPDAGVRSRAATVLGECAGPALLITLWERVIAAEDVRVQDKAWSAILSIMGRHGKIELLNEWDHILAEAKQDQRRLQLLSATYDIWKRKDDNSLVIPAMEALIQAQLDQGKWADALPLVKELLHRPANDADKERRLRWLLVVGEQSLKDGKNAETRQVLLEAQPFLAEMTGLSKDFENLQRKIQGKN